MSTWARQQAEAQRAAKAQQRAEDNEAQMGLRKAKEFFAAIVTKSVQQQSRLDRLSIAFADRCHRVTELMGQLRAEWERAERAEARVSTLEPDLAWHQRRVAELEQQLGIEHPEVLSLPQQSGQGGGVQL